MADPLIITALRNKRAELAGDLGVTEARLTRLAAEIAALDMTLRVFDPEQRPSTIRAKVKRAGQARFRTGELTRTILAGLREAKAPMSVRDMTEHVARVHGLDVSQKRVLDALLAGVRTAMVRPRQGIVREGEAGAYRWRLA